MIKLLLTVAFEFFPALNHLAFSPPPTRDFAKIVVLLLLLLLMSFKGTGWRAVGRRRKTWRVTTIVIASMCRGWTRTAERSQIVKRVRLVNETPLQNSPIDSGHTIDNLIRHVFIFIVTDEHNRSQTALIADVLGSFHIIAFEYELTTLSHHQHHVSCFN